MSCASGVPDTPHRNRNNIPDLLRSETVKVSVKDGCDDTMVVCLQSTGYAMEATQMSSEVFHSTER